MKKWLKRLKKFIGRILPVKSKNGNGMTVTDRIQLSRARFRFLLAILVLTVYSATIYFLFVQRVK